MRRLQALDRAASLGSCCAAIPITQSVESVATICISPTRILPRAGGCTFAEAPCRPASEARLLWSSAFDPSVLCAWPIRTRGDADGTCPIEDCLAVSGRKLLHTVIGGIHHGVRIDIAGSRAALSLDRMIFPITIADARKQSAEFKRLLALVRGQGVSARAPTAQLRRIVLGLRVIDALGEGASLRMIGETFVRVDDWPGEGESTKSTARRLVDLARRMSAGGPAKILSGQRL